jgi:hypothetical protein
MKYYCFAGASTFDRAGLSVQGIIRLLENVAVGTDTRDLVVVLYLLPGIHRSRGTAYVRRWMTAREFQTGRGRWGFTRKYPVPRDLPAKFKLIRMRLDPAPGTFPRTERDGYRWLFQYRSFSDQLATLFAHELHHFRRHHLGLHPHQGEHAANQWALQTVRRLGYAVEGKRIPAVKKAEAGILRLFPKIRKWTDPYSRLRGLKIGTRVVIVHDPRGRYRGEVTTLVRSVRSNSKRVVIQTSDGKIWRWPMAWIKLHVDGM